MMPRGSPYLERWITNAFAIFGERKKGEKKVAKEIHAGGRSKKNSRNCELESTPKKIGKLVWESLGG